MRVRPTTNFAAGCAAGLLVLIHTLLPASAAGGVAVSPLQQWIEIKPGGEKHFTVTVSNVKRSSGARPHRLRVEVMDFTVSAEGKLSFGRDMNEKRSAAPWIRLNTREFVLEPGQSRPVKGTVSVPLGADGDYWAAVMVTLLQQGRTNNGVRVVLRTASGVFIHVARRNYLARSSITDTRAALPSTSPEENPGETAELDTGRGADGTESALRVSMLARNVGRVAFKGEARALLYDTNRRRVASIPMHASRKRLLPGHVRRFEGVMAMPLPAGSYTLRIILDSGGERGRKTLAEKDVRISPAVAKRWAERRRAAGDARPRLNLNSDGLELSLSPGRFTVGQLQVANQGADTVSVECRFLPDSLPEKWADLNTGHFTLGPGMRRGLVCSVKVPRGVEPGRYRGTIRLQVQSAGAPGRTRAPAHTVPVVINVEKRGKRS